MSKDTPFFKFDSSSWLAGSIQFTDLETKGLFIDLCAIYWESSRPIQIDTKFKVRTRCPEGTLSNLISTLRDLDIIEQSEHGITIPFLDNLKNERQEWLKKCSNAGKKSHAVRGTSSNKKEERRKKSVERREEKEDIKDIKKVNQKKTQASRFSPPTISEVSDYCLSRNNTVDPEKFVNFYESKGWLVGKVKMKSWQAAVRTWEDKKPPKDITGGWGLS